MNNVSLQSSFPNDGNAEGSSGELSSQEVAVGETVEIYNEVDNTVAKVPNLEYLESLSIAGIDNLEYLPADQESEQ